MAGRLRTLRGPAPRRRAWLPLLLTLPVLLSHLWLGEWVWDLQRDWTEVAPMPPRMTAAFVRELAPALPARPAHSALPAPGPALPARKALLAPAAAAASQAGESVDEAPAAASAAAGATVFAPVRTAEVAASSAAPATQGLADDAVGPEWPLSTRLSYRLLGNYRGEVHGSAQVEWLRQGRHYQMHLDVIIGPEFAPLITRRTSSDGELTSEGISPRRYDEDTKIMFRDRSRATVQFLGERVLLADGAVGLVPPDTQDSVSQFVHLTWLFLTGRQTLRDGLVVDVPLALPRKLYRWRYEVLGEETLYTPMGELQAWHLRPQNVAGAGMLSAEVWLAPTLQYLPVRIRIRQDEDTYIDLMLRAPPLQAAP